MRLILFDRPGPERLGFEPLALSRPIWELRCGMTSLGAKLLSRLCPWWKPEPGGSLPVASALAAGGEAAAGAGSSAAKGLSAGCFVPDYMAAAYGARTDWPVNDPALLRGDDLLLVHGRLKADHFHWPLDGPSMLGVDSQGRVVAARIAAADLERLDTSTIDALLASAPQHLPTADQPLSAWNYTWELVLANAEQITADFGTLGRTGVEGVVEEPCPIRGNRKDVYIARGAVLHPMVVIDAEHGPVFIDEGAQIHSFTRIEGPCYIGRGSILLGAKCREGNTIGPMCRVGGEVEESIIHGYSNKYHDGFLGHAYVGEWVNLGALTSNSDLKNDYTSVSVILDGRTPVDTGSTKVGALIGDHAKTSIGVLLNTGAYVGAMAIVAATGKPLPKFIPSFAWFLEGVVTKGFGKKQLYETAKIVMSRRGCTWTAAEQAMWDEVYNLTAPVRNEAIKRGRRALAGGQAPQQ
jgi:UDP-N-acetylglucosamine diphosphorylase/glucosamine-1-phosphate N-acetyltransferase